MSENNGIISKAGEAISKTTGAIANIPKAFTDALEKMERDAYAGWGKYASHVMGLIQNLESTVAPLAKVQKEFTNLAKAAGLAGSSVMAMSKRAIEANKALSLSMKYGFSNEEMIRLQTGIMGRVERNVMMTQMGRTYRDQNGNVAYQESELELANAISRAYGPDVTMEAIAKYDKFGKSISSVAKTSAKMYKEAGKYGISLSKYAQNFIGNLEMAQKYSFRNGVNGLKEMARRATEIRQDMSQVAAFAEKVGTVTGAVETAANLQVLGGSFTRLASPLAMLNEGLTDMEGLQKRLAQMSEGAAYYDQKTHEIRMDPVTRNIMKRAAESMGIDSTNFIDQSFAQARRREIERQMQGLNIDTNIRDVLMNAGTIDSETGVAGANIGGQFYSLSEITPELASQLVAETRTEGEDIKAIAQSVMHIEDRVTGVRGQMENEMAYNGLAPGIYKGRSAWDIVVDALGRFDEDAIEGIRKISLVQQNLATIAESVRTGFHTEVVKAFAGDNIEDIAEGIRTAVGNIVPDGEVQRVLQEIFGGLAENLINLSEKINKYFEETGGINFLAPTTASFGEITADKGVIVNGTDLSIYGAGAAPIARGNSETVDQVRQATTNEDRITVQPMSFNGLEGSITAGINESNLIIKANENSLPGATFTSTGSPQTQGEAGATQPQDIKLSFSGDFTLYVKGENGDLGSIDVTKMIERWIRQNPNEFDNFVHKMIEQAAKQDNHI